VRLERGPDGHGVDGNATRSSSTGSDDLALGTSETFLDSGAGALGLDAVT
jgi:hypothetical protein